MVRPVGLIDDIEGQTQSVNTALDQIKDFALNLGEERQSSELNQMNAQAFSDLVMKRGRE